MGFEDGLLIYNEAGLEICLGWQGGWWIVYTELCIVNTADRRWLAWPPATKEGEQR